MFGMRFIKTQPTQYVMAFRDGKPRRQGAGLSMFYFAPTTSLVVVPTAMDAERAVREERRQIEQEDMAGKITVEQERGHLVELAATNARQEADAKGYGIDAVMKAFAGADAKILQALASVGMQPGQLMALAFRELADNAGKIGQLNISPDLLREIMGGQEAH